MAEYNVWQNRRASEAIPDNRQQPGEGVFGFIKRRLGEGEREANERLVDKTPGYPGYRWEDLKGWYKGLSDKSGSRRRNRLGGYQNVNERVAREMDREEPNWREKLDKQALGPDIVENPSDAIGGSDDGSFTRMFKKSKNPPKVVQSKTTNKDGSVKPVKVSDMEKALYAWRTRKGKLDLSPLMALTDSLTGSQLLRGYQAPMDADERMQMDMKLSMALEQEKRKIEHDKQWLKVSNRQLDMKEEQHKILKATAKVEAAFGGDPVTKAKMKAQAAEEKHVDAILGSAMNKAKNAKIIKERMVMDGEWDPKNQYHDSKVKTRTREWMYELSQLAKGRGGATGYQELIDYYSQDGYSRGGPSNQGE